MRLILDLSELNHFVEKKKVKIKDWNAALNYFRKDCCFFLIQFLFKILLPSHCQKPEIKLHILLFVGEVFFTAFMFCFMV